MTDDTRDDNASPPSTDPRPPIPLAAALLEAAEMLNRVGETVLQLEGLLVDAARRGVTP